VALDALTGTKLWRLFFKSKKFSYIGVSNVEEQSFVQVCSRKECLQINPKSGEFQHSLKGSDLIVSSIKTAPDQNGLVAVDANLMVSL
jgi:transposase-like protein